MLGDMEVRLDDAARVMGSARGVSTGRVSRQARQPEGVDSPTWAVPEGIGALPAELAERAQDVLVNQRKIVGELEKAKRVTLQHLAAVRSVPPARNPGTSVYLDVAG
ncbi:hypothetical protein D6T64_11095 [Cryobacterium melibiosiphilum]|uniref:Uncharacterized protein n=1 Tax=Cryobacterium melibiosiphilum TaxID=995039 RepID=A0A3A5MFJ5_9MICO|nr:hypothetical protein D6T64_11095 [Cryobacterium melibiosiphilum]